MWGGVQLNVDGSAFSVASKSHAKKLKNNLSQNPTPKTSPMITTLSTADSKVTMCRVLFCSSLSRWVCHGLLAPGGKARVTTPRVR